MKRIAYVVAALLLPLSAWAESIAGEIQLEYSDSGFTKAGFKQEFGNAVKATSNWYVGDFFGRETVFAGVTATNTTDRPMFFEYYVAFFDKDKKLVGAIGQGSSGEEGLKPGKATHTGSCLIHLPKGKYKEIVSYQATIYETDIPPQKKKRGLLP